MELSQPLITCSLCLRVRRGARWVAAENVIRDLRSYDLPLAPPLAPALCDECAEKIAARRVHVDDTRLAA